MSSESREAFEKRTRSDLRPDIGVVENETCECRNCDEDARYRVPWPAFGGDVAYCGYHLARYRGDNPEIWCRLRDLDAVEDPDRYAVRGDRFLTLKDVPDQVAVDGEVMNRVALGVDGLALYDSAEPDSDGTVRFATVDRRLEAVESIAVDRSDAGDLVRWYRDHEGVHRIDPDARASLYGGEQP